MKNTCKHWVTTDCSYGDPFCKYCGMSAEAVGEEERQKELKKKKSKKSKKKKTLNEML